MWGARYKPLAVSQGLGPLRRLSHQIAAAHELRTPLAVINAQAHVLAKATNEQARAAAEQYLDAAITRASHLIHQPLVLARMEMERKSAQNIVDVAQLVRQELAHFVRMDGQVWVTPGA